MDRGGSRDRGEAMGRGGGGSAERCWWEAVERRWEAVRSRTYQRDPHSRCLSHLLRATPALTCRVHTHPHDGYSTCCLHPATAVVALLRVIPCLTFAVPTPHQVTPTLKMVVGYAKMLDPADPLLTSRGLKQHPRAAMVWRQCILPPISKGGGDLDSISSESSEWDRAQACCSNASHHPTTVPARHRSVPRITTNATHARART